MTAFALSLSEPVERSRTVAEIAAETIRPLARTIDQDGFYPDQALQDLGAAGAFGRHATGTGDGLMAAIADTSRVAETCLSTAFCMWCQNALVWYLAKTENQPLRQRLLHRFAQGERLGGTGLSNPMKAASGIEPVALRGVETEGGYTVTGRLPWVSNLAPGHAFAGVFTLAGGRKVMAVFETAAPGLRMRQNVNFIALEGTGTYSVAMQDVFVPHEDVLAEDAGSFIPGIRQGFVLLQLGMGLGLARGVAQAMQNHAASRANALALPLQPDAILEQADGIEARAADLAERNAVPEREPFLNVLALRQEAAWLAMNAAQAGALQAGAAGYVAGSDTHRRHREALFVGIVTPSIKHITTELARGVN